MNFYVVYFSIIAFFLFSETILSGKEEFAVLTDENAISVLKFLTKWTVYFRSSRTSFLHVIQVPEVKFWCIIVQTHLIGFSLMQWKYISRRIWDWFSWVIFQDVSLGCWLSLYRVLIFLTVEFYLVFSNNPKITKKLAHTSKNKLFAI